MPKLLTKNSLHDIIRLICCVWKKETVMLDKYISTYKDKIHVYKIEGSYGACLYGGFFPVIIVGNNANLSLEQQNMILHGFYLVLSP